MRLLFSLALTLIFLFSAAQNNDSTTSSIRGFVRGDSSQPVPAATIHLKGASRQVITNREGRFLLEGIAPGTYTLQISSIGFMPLEQAVTLTPGAAVEVAISLQPGDQRLNEIVVSAGRTPETIDEIPSSVSIIGQRKLQQNLNITTNLGDIL